MSTRWYGSSGSSSSAVSGCIGLLTIWACRPHSPSTRGRRRCSGCRRIEARRSAAAATARPATGSRSRRTERGAPCRCAVSGIAAPHDRHLRQLAPDALADGDRLRQLGPGITVTASSEIRVRGTMRSCAMIGRGIRGEVAVDERPGVAARLEHAASDISDSGSGCFPGVVDSGLKRTMIAPPTARTPPARGPAAPATAGGAAASRAGRATARTRAAAPAAPRSPQGARTSGSRRPG